MPLLVESYLFRHVSVIVVIGVFWDKVARAQTRAVTLLSTLLSSVGGCGDSLVAEAKVVTLHGALPHACGGAHCMFYMFGVPETIPRRAPAI